MPNILSPADIKFTQVQNFLVVIVGRLGGSCVRVSASIAIIWVRGLWEIIAVPTRVARGEWRLAGAHFLPRNQIIHVRENPPQSPQTGYFEHIIFILSYL